MRRYPWGGGHGWREALRGSEHCSKLVEGGGPQGVTTMRRSAGSDLLAAATAGRTFVSSCPRAPSLQVVEVESRVGAEVVDGGSFHGGRIVGMDGKEEGA